MSFNNVLWMAFGALASFTLGAPVLAQSAGYQAEFTTSLGRFTCRLDDARAPKAVANFIGLATGGRSWLDPATGQERTNAFFNGLIFHQVSPGAFILSGSPDGTLASGPGYTFEDDPTSSAAFDRPGLLAMLSDGPNRNGSQFVITLSAPSPPRTFGTIFGQVISGQDVADAIGRVAVDPNGRPLTPVVLERVLIQRVGAETDQFDPAAQDLPAVLNPPVSLERRGAALVVEFAGGPGTTTRIFSSTNLVSWRSRELPSENASLVVTQTMNLPREFFRFAQVRRSPGEPENPFRLPISAEGLEGYWKLDGDWSDALGRHDLTPHQEGGFSPSPYVGPISNAAYGPTGALTNNGARSPSWTRLSETNGITLEAWVSLPDDNTGGVLFGFGDGSWDWPKLCVLSAWGYLQASIGRQGDGADAEYARIGDSCWHHVALVLPKGFRGDQPFRFYLDGQKLAPRLVANSRTETNLLTDKATIFGAPFGIGEFLSRETGGSGGLQKVDEARVWTRELSAAEIAELAIPRGLSEKKCDEVRPPHWAPGPRFTPPVEAPVPVMKLAVHVLTDDTVAVISDPNPWLKERFQADCGPFFRAVEEARPNFESWVAPLYYELAAAEVVQHYRPPLLAALGAESHLRFSGPGLTAGPAASMSLWPHATREFRAPRLAPGRGEEHVGSAEVVYYSYCKLPFRLQPGSTYRVEDAWGNRVEWTYAEDSTISWSLKVNQVGYLADAPEKYGYFGAWLGPQTGPLDLSRFDGAPFHVCREADGGVAFAGAIRFRADESRRISPLNAEPIVLSGENVYELDFSPLTLPGRYYLRVPGAGRSWAFEIGQEAMGAAFYSHARGLFHQRCGASLLPSHTPWARGDAHTNTFRAAFPAEPDAFADHTAAGWGFQDVNGRFPTGPANADLAFASVAATATSERLPDVIGGWHDAGDFDRAGWRNILTVQDLAEAYLLFPENFTDGQLHLPESGNGIPDILDEASWGLDVWRRAQEPDGRVALHIEADSHPTIADPAIDQQPYYLGLATHNSSLLYAEHAARLARALLVAGALEAAAPFLESARRAYGFGAGDGPRVSIRMNLWDQPVSWREADQPNPQHQVRALTQLWLATGDAMFRAALDRPEMQRAFFQEIDDLYWRTSAFDCIDVALAPDRFPEGWADYARRGIIKTAEDWLAAQESHAYRKLWYAPDHPYFGLLQWGASGFRHLREPVAAWRLTRQAKFRAAALKGVDWMHGANPQGRVYTTGLGANSVVHPLHLPADSDGISDPVPGISIYGPSYPIPYNARTAVYGLFSEPRVNDGFFPVALAQLPPPWDNSKLSQDDIAAVLYQNIPLWRRIFPIEAGNPPQMEFGLNETIGPAAAVTGCLLGPGWMPSARLIDRPPRSIPELQESLWWQP